MNPGNARDTSLLFIELKGLLKIVDCNFTKRSLRKLLYFNYSRPMNGSPGHRCSLGPKPPGPVGDAAPPPERLFSSVDGGVK